MDFKPNDDHVSIREAIGAVCRDFDEHYWLKKDNDHTFPLDFHQAMARGGWLGIAMPQEYGGSGQGILEAAIMMETVSGSGAGMSGASALHMNIFGLHPVVVFGTERQKQRWLPPLIQGEEKACFGVTEPNTGLNTLALKTSAVRKGDHYVVSGQKIWISTAQVADRILLLARTTPQDQVQSKTEGLTLFYTKLDRDFVDIHEIQKHGRASVDSNQLFIDELAVPIEDRIGEEGQGFRYLLHGLNPERILVAAEAVGLGRAALRYASRYAQERHVFNRPIGMNQGIQHPLAERWIELEAAELMYQKAAWLYDNNESCAAHANAAKFLASESGYKACETAVLTHGGMGYAKEYHVERLLREAMLPRIAPVSQNMILCFIAEKVLGQAKSY
ncbi:MAG: acyl-CoA/acyl-ACP dehydrogenase [Achromobacter sp.]|uniref:acyl-CoA dehydrogenase family protein n=1 Tax=Achromobacter sp. TaxID=134375 RepID=UPI00258383B1|nr:acyl-CoA dehydrogenase family protein [Achromobacter sp.]MCW0210361.1 acyl-CoA/acyl-ACP dehydrogenase [Achromobacter sp.]